MGIEIKNFSYKYPLEDKNVLENLNLKIEKGEFWAVIGKNGSGKTTLCNALRRFVPDFYKGEVTGEIVVDGKNLKDFSPKELVTKIGFVFQNPFTQISGVKDTVFEEIAYGLENLAVEKEKIIKRVNETLKLLEIEHLKDKNPQEMSGGQKQRVALASIIVMDPEILVIDEPTSQLDPKGTQDIFKIINIMAKKGKTIILSGKASEVLNNKSLLEKGIGMTQYSMLAYELEKSGKAKFEEIPITKEKTVELLKK